MKKIFAFVGASGTGKSSLGQYLQKKYSNIEFREVSARPFLENLEKSYDEQMTDKIQNRIMYGNLDKVYQTILEAQFTEKIIVLSRCCIDVLAYARTLKHGLDCEDLQEKTIYNLRKNIVLLYTVPDFPLSDQTDKQRGMNESVRQETDKQVKNILDSLGLNYYTLKGDLKERQNYLDEIVKIENLKRELFSKKEL